MSKNMDKKLEEAELEFKRIQKEYNHPVIQQLGATWYHLKMIDLLGSKRPFLKEMFYMSRFIATQICYIGAGFSLAKHNIYGVLSFWACAFIGYFLLKKVTQQSRTQQELDESVGKIKGFANIELRKTKENV